jgi:hypothetical protein
VEKKQSISHADATQVLRRAGYSQERIQELLRDLPDPIDPERDSVALVKRGMSAGELMDRMGASP